MKTRFSFFVLVLFFVTPVFSQQPVRPVAGIKFGLNASWLLYEENIDKTFRTGAVGGIFLRFPTSRGLSVQLEALYSMEGAKSEGRQFGISDQVRIPETYAVLDYLKLPFLLRFGDEHSSLSFLTGPSMSLLIKGERVVRGLVGEPDQITDYDDFANERIFSWIAGVAIKVSDHVNLDARYTFGITPTFNVSSADNDYDDRNQTISVMLEAGIR